MSEIDKHNMESLQTQTDKAKDSTAYNSSTTSQISGYDYRLKNMEDDIDALKEKTTQLDSEYRTEFSQIKDELADTRKSLKDELDKLAESEQEYKDNMNSQVKQILLTILGVVATAIISKFVG